MEIYTKIHNKWYYFHINSLAKNNYSLKIWRKWKASTGSFLHHNARLREGSRETGRATSPPGTSKASLSLPTVLAPPGAR